MNSDDESSEFESRYVNRALAALFPKQDPTREVSLAPRRKVNADLLLSTVGPEKVLAGVSVAEGLLVEVVRSATRRTWATLVVSLVAGMASIGVILYLLFGCVGCSAADFKTFVAAIVSLLSGGLFVLYRSERGGLTSLERDVTKLSLLKAKTESLVHKVN